MADYTKTFNGADRDAAESIVVPDEWDTEYSSIATAIATKANIITSPVADNLIELDANGDIVDSGIADSNLTGVTATDVQAVIDSAISVSAVASSDFARATSVHITNGEEAAVKTINLQSGSNGTWQTYGGVSSGATHTDADWDSYVQSGARIVGGFLRVTLADSTGTVAVYAVDGGVASGSLPSAEEGNEVFRWEADEDVTTGTQSTTYSTWVWLPFGSGGTVWLQYFDDATMVASISFLPRLSIKV